MYAQTICRILCLTELFCRHYEMIIEDYYSYSCSGMNTVSYTHLVDLPREKRIEIGLTYIYGIGRPSADKILAKAEVNPDTRVRDLTDDEVKRLSAVIDETMTVEGLSLIHI